MESERPRGRGASPSRAIFLTWPEPATIIAGDGAGHPVLRVRRPSDRVRLRRRGPAAPLRRPVGDPPRGGVGRSRCARASSKSSRGRIASSATTGSARGCPSASLPSPADGRVGGERSSRPCSTPARDGAATLFACSCAGLATARFASSAPERVDKIVFFGGYVSRDDIPEATRRSLVDFARMNWMLAAQMLAGLFVPRAGGDEIAALSRYQRHAADADVAAAFLELDLASDAAGRPAAGHGARARPPPPRRPDGADRPRARARVAAAERALRRARRRRAPAVDGRPARAPARARRLPRRRRSSPRRTATRRSADARRRCCASSPPGSRTARSPPSLVLSEHTVHRHVANILRKLGESSRAAAAAHATRAGYI